MKKFGVYSAIWAIALGIFNLIVFLTPNEVGGMDKFGGAFWVGYIAITVAFVAQLVCAFFALKEKNLTKLFYNISLIKISYTGLIVMLIAGTLCMAIPNLPNWIGIIVCAIILLLNAIVLIKASAAAHIVAGVDQKIAAETAFIKGLTAKAESLTKTADDDLRAIAKKVYEVIRYSDPVSNTALASLDAQIGRQFTAFSDAVKGEDLELAKNEAAALIEMLENRNQQCKCLK